jgi:DNA-binding transcriptional LysR family regulator
VPLLSTPAVCILPAAHPLAAREQIDVRDLEGAEFISIGRDARSGIQVDRTFAEAGVGRTIVLETQTAAVACAFVKEGLGVSIIDPLTAATQADDRLVVRPFAPRFDFTFSALVRNDRPLPRIAQLFLDDVRAASSAVLQ